MKLHWSHAVLNVKNLDEMLAFYTETLEFTISDRGPIGDADSPEIVFLSHLDSEHHQIAMVAAPGDWQNTSLNHLSFRVESFAEVKRLHAKLVAREQRMAPISHGNTLSIYFSDPEKNGIEVFWDTPWHVDQPQGVAWDASLDETAALKFVEETFSKEPSFCLREDAARRFVNLP